MTEQNETKSADPAIKSYKVTEHAGPFVAGRRSPGAGKDIKLTERQAETPLRNGEIEETAAKPSGKNSGKGA